MSAINVLTGLPMQVLCSFCGEALPEQIYATLGLPYLCCSSECLDQAIRRSPTGTQTPEGNTD